MSTIEEDAQKRRDEKRKPGGKLDYLTETEDKENQDASNNQQEKVDDSNDAGIINEGISGVSKKNFVMSVDNDSEASKKGIDDKYSAPTSSIPASDADDEDKRDSRT